MIRSMNESDREWAGLRLQHFAVLKNSDGAPWVLGRGAGGVTYKAIDVELQRTVALKVLDSSALDSEEAKKLFRHEARVAAALRHPNLAAIHHFGEQDGVCFYAMEFVEGQNLEEYVREHGPLQADTALDLAAQAASALGAAHQAGLVHRDVKPANLLLREDAKGAAQIKLIDFGLATAAIPGSASARSVRFSGTLLYASPEQLDDHAVDPRSDLYSLGATLFFLLTGQPPFNGSLSQLVTQHTIAPAPVHAIPGSPTAAAAVVERLMSKNPQDRPASGTEACMEIEAARDQSRSAERRTAAEWLTTHFAVLRRTGEIEGGAAYRATRHPGEAETPVLFFDRTAAGCALADRFRAAAACLRRLTSPCIRQIESIIEVSDGVLVVFAPPVEAVRLLSVMRKRRTLPVREALVLLQPLAAALDEAATAGLSLPPLGLRDVRLAPAHPSETPLDEWAGLHPVVDLLPLGPAQGHDAAATVVGTSLGNHAELDANEVFQPGQVIASLAYEMIGGMSAPGSTHFVPLAELSAETNRFLRGVFADPAGTSTAGEIVERLQRDAKVSPAEAPPAAAPGHGGHGRRPIHRGPAKVERTASQTAHGSNGSRRRVRAWTENALLMIAVAVIVHGVVTGWAPLPNRDTPSASAVASEAEPTLAAPGNSSGGTIATGIGSSSSLSAGLAGLPETNTMAPATPAPEAPPDADAATAVTPSIQPDAGETRRIEWLPEDAAGTRSDLSSATRDHADPPSESLLGVVDVSTRDGEEGGIPSKVLRFGVKARPGTPIDGRDVRIDVTFYETVNGEVVPTMSRVQSTWLTAPMDWQNEGTEILELKCEKPQTGVNGGPPPRYYGYMVNIYHRGQLQETRADPVDLQILFPPPPIGTSSLGSPPESPPRPTAPPNAAPPLKPVARPVTPVAPQAAAEPKPTPPRYIAVDVPNKPGAKPGAKEVMVYDTKTGQLVGDTVYQIRGQATSATTKPPGQKRNANQSHTTSTRYIAVETSRAPNTPANAIPVMIFDTKTMRLVGPTVYNLKKRPRLGAVSKYGGVEATFVGKRN